MPLSGIRVVDLTRILAGPYATMVLGDYGADVIKVERPDGGDDTRAWGPPWVPGAAGASAYFTAINRNKRSCSIDLKAEAGREVLWRLVERADILISNFRPGVLERLGFPYEAVRARNPRLIYAVINGYGAQGPAAQKPAFDLIVQGESGVMDITGQPDGPPTRVGISLADLTAALVTVQGILAALLERTRTGEGQRLEVALHDTLLSLHIYHAQAWWAGGRPPARLGSAHPSLVPYQAFATADGWMTLGVGNERQWTALCDALGRPEWAADPRFRTNRDRLAHREELVRRLMEILLARPTAEWTRILGEAEVPCGAIRSVPEALASPEVRDRGVIVEVPGADGSPLPLIGPPVRLSASPPRVRRRPPALGEHTEEVLADLGFGADEIGSLEESGVIGRGEAARNVEGGRG